MLEINGHTKQLGIIGYPVEHSFSPKMHNFISEKLHNNYVYSAWCVEPSNLENAILGIRALGIKGVNVTAPHKKEVMKYIDVIDDGAKKLGAVNTVVNKDGVLYGYNTDSDGFYMSLEKNGVKIKNGNILVIGAGGVTRPTLIGLLSYNPAGITVVNRTKEKAVSLAEDIFKSTGFRINTEPTDMVYDIVINTTSAGMSPQEDVLPIDNIECINNLDFINGSTCVVDMIYNPDETLFLREAKKRGAKTINGLGMLINQGVIAYELFTDTKLDGDMENYIRKEVFGR